MPSQKELWCILKMARKYLNAVTRDEIKKPHNKSLERALENVAKIHFSFKVVSRRKAYPVVVERR